MENNENPTGGDRHSKDSGGGSKGSDKGSANSKKSAKKVNQVENEDAASGGTAGTNETVPDKKGRARFGRTVKVAPAAEDNEGGDTVQKVEEKQVGGGMKPSQVLDVLQFLPPEALKTVKILPAKKRRKSRPKMHSDKPPGPIASKVIFLKKPEPEEEEEEEVPEDIPMDEGPEEIAPEEPIIEPPPILNAPQTNTYDIPFLFFTHDLDRMLKETNDEQDIDNKLNNLMDAHRGDQLKKLKKATAGRTPKFKFGDMIRTLNKMGIPCPTNEDFARLHGLHSRWDPDGTVVEYFSPMLRTFIPINMRGRYRGCWPNDTCMKGLDISKVPPKRDALEGFVERGRHANIQEKYDEMSEVAVDEPHLDYLIEMQALQAETLPIPIFYDMLHLGMQVANESLRILVQEEGYPPNNSIFTSQLEHAEQLRRKIQLYGALGLERLESQRKGLGEYLPHWLKTRDEIIRDIMANKDSGRYENLTKKEEEAKERETMRHLQEERETEAAAAAAAASAAGARHSLAAGDQNIRKASAAGSNIKAPLRKSVPSLKSRANKVQNLMQVKKK